MTVSLLVPGAGSAVDAAMVVAGATEMLLRCDLDLAAALSWGRVLNSFRTADLGLALYCFSIAAVHIIACYRRPVEPVDLRQCVCILLSSRRVYIRPVQTLI